MRLRERSCTANASSSRRNQTDVGQTRLRSVETGCSGSLNLWRRLPRIVCQAVANADSNAVSYRPPSRYSSLSDQSLSGVPTRGRGQILRKGINHRRSLMPGSYTVFIRPASGCRIILRATRIFHPVCGKHGFCALLQRCIHQTAHGPLMQNLPHGYASRGRLKVTSNTQCREFSIPQWPRTASRIACRS